jgi:hypothetical protein
MFVLSQNEESGKWNSMSKYIIWAYVQILYEIVFISRQLELTKFRVF